jgi:hypothetical protein
MMLIDHRKKKENDKFCSRFKIKEYEDSHDKDRRQQRRYDDDMFLNKSMFRNQ